MKKYLSVLFASILVMAMLSACSLLPGAKPAPQPTQAAQAATEAAKPSESVAAQAESTASKTQATTEKAVGKLEDYVRTAKEATFVFDNGPTNTYRIPEILLSGEEAKAANDEIMERFGDDVQSGSGYCPVISLDYEAYLNDKYLSVIVSGRFDGGNSYGLCYTFDVTTAKNLDSETLCSVTGRDYNASLNTLGANLTTEYDSRFGSLPGNDKERTKTLDVENLGAAKMYLGSSGKLMAMVDLYAAVGGGHWTETIGAE